MLLKKNTDITNISNLFQNPSKSMCEPSDNLNFKRRSETVDINFTINGVRRKSFDHLDKDDNTINYVRDTDEDFDPTEEIFHDSHDENHDLFFGELFDNQTERLRKISPFGHLSTWRLFKMIGIILNNP